MKHIFFGLLLSLGIITNCTAQDGDLQKKNLSDTILLPTRTLQVKGNFDDLKVLKQLFPGKYYDLSSGKYKNQLINWECKTCKPKSYIDENEGSSYDFPYAAGTATRLLKVYDYKDSSGTQYKMLTFNHSEFDPDGAQVSRFTGGTIGFAKFTLIDSVWTLKYFQPATGAYGAFSQCPSPELILIGHDQYAFMIKSSNGGAGGPFYGNLYLIAGADGTYKEVLSANWVERTNVEENMSAWTCTYNAPVSNKRFFRDIIVTIKGTYNADDFEDVPEEVKPYAKSNKKGKFTLAKRYVYKWGKGYQFQGPAGVTVD
jgi:hypothetical protein